MVFKSKLALTWMGIFQPVSLSMSNMLQPCKWPNAVGNTAASLHEAPLQYSGIKTGKLQVRGAWGGWMGHSQDFPFTDRASGPI